MFCYVVKSGRDPGMIIKRREEISTGGNKIFKRVKLSEESQITGG